MPVDQVRRGCFAVAVLVSLGILFSPASAVPAVPAGTDVLVHTTLFAALAYTGVLSGLPRPATALLLLASAAASELIQSAPALNRSASPLDWLADAVGIGTGLALSVVLRRRPERWWAPPQ